METLIKTFTVTEKDTAKKMGSGSLDVLATPIMIAWMENTAMTIANRHIEEGETSVGILMNAQHVKASGIGETIQCKATETLIDGRKLTFEIECYNENKDIIGTATHERFIVNSEKFMKKVNG